MTRIARPKKSTKNTTKRARRPIAASTIRRAKKATRKTVASTAGEPKQAVNVPATPKPEAPPAPKPHPLAAAKTLYDHGAPRWDLTDLELVTAMFTAPNAPCIGNPAADFLAGVLLSNADELDAATAMNNGLDNCEVIGRINMRAGYRAAIAVELARRAEKAVRS